MPNIIVATLDELSLEGLIRLGAAYYPEGHPARRADYLDWLYMRNPCGKSKLAVVVREDGSYAGMMAMVPVPIIHGADTFIGRYVVNVLVHPNERGRNLFVLMVKASKEVTNRSGEWLLGHPNDAATPGWRRTRMEFRPGAETLVRLPGAGAWHRGYRPFQPNNGTGARSLENYDFASLRQWQRALGHPVVAADQAFLKWRYLEHPVNAYTLMLQLDGNRVLSYVVLRRFRRFAHLAVDWEGEEAWRLGPPSIPSAPILVPWPIMDDQTARPRFLFSVSGAKKTFRFFATPPDGKKADGDSWQYLTLGASDIG